jgi:hypothetical protein
VINNAYRRVGLATVLAMLAATSNAFAGGGAVGTVVYAPPAESIPALSGAMLVVLGLLLSVLAYRVLRTYPGGRPLASLVALAIAGLSAVSGIRVMQEAYAAPYPTYPMTQANGGSISIYDFGISVSVTNSTGRTQEIKNVNPANSCLVGSTSSPVCAPGTIVQANASCNVRFDCAPPPP